MNTKTRLLALTAAMALTAATAPSAWALQTEWVATGTVYNGYDITGVFGPAGESLDGDAFTATYYIDTSRGLEDVGNGYNTSYGGYTDGTSSPLVAKLTINGTTEIISGSYYGTANVNNDGQEGQVSASAQEYLPDSGVAASYVQVETGSAGSDATGYPNMIGQAFSVSSSVSNGGDFEIYNPNLGGLQAEGSFLTTSISSPGVISAAPEPSAWALLLAGVGLSGLALRLGRRRDWAAV